MIPIAMQITNLTKSRVAFKVKTTSPKKYCVRPSHGFIAGNSVKEVQVILQPQKEAPGSYQNCKDKFLVQTAVVDAGVNEVTADMFDAAKNSGQVQQTKLRVTMVPPGQPPSPVPEGTEEVGTPQAKTLHTESLVSPGVMATASGDVSSRVQPRREEAERHARSGGFGILTLLLVALVAFVLGYFAKGSIPELDLLKEKILKQFGGYIWQS